MTELNLIEVLRQKIKDVKVFGREDIPVDKDFWIGGKGDQVIVLKNNGSRMIIETSKDSNPEHTLEMINELFG